MTDQQRITEIEKRLSQELQRSGFSRRSVRLIEKDIPFLLSVLTAKDAEIERLQSIINSPAVAYMSSPIGDLPIDSTGMRKAVDEIARLTEALEIAERGHVNCMSAERQSDGKCLGYGRGENDDEPCAQCANCPQCTAHEPETKTIQEWAKLDGIFVYDPDGFNRADPLLWEKEITKAEYLAVIAFCTVLPLPAAPEKGE